MMRGPLSRFALILFLILFNHILCAGTLIAIIVQWLTETMERLERGTTPITLHQHIVVQGWTSRTPTLLGETALGLRRVGEKGTPHAGVRLNPRRDEPLRLNEGDELIVLTTLG